MNIVEKARIFATASHHAAGNVRKYTGEPYINHPAAVVALVASVPHTPEMLAASWLHDTVEDTGVSLGLIEQEFGPEVANLVEMLTEGAPELMAMARQAISEYQESRQTLPQS